MDKFDLFLKIFLPLFVVALLLITYVYNIISFKKKYGKDPRATTKEDSIMYIIELYRSVMFVLTLIIIAVYALLPEYYKYLLPVYYLENMYLQLSGVVLMISGLILVRVAQIQLKSSYRIGIDRSDKTTELITNGVYSWSRNPITLGLFIITIGVFFIIPNAITFTIVNLTFLVISIRSMIEEKHLENLHGEKYLNYKSKVRRWL